MILLAGVWGIGDAVANAVMYSIIGGYFDEETEVGDAFAHLKLWQSLACAVVRFLVPSRVCALSPAVTIYL